MSVTETVNDDVEELYHIQELTNDDGTVDVEITDWEKEEYSNSSAKVNIEFRTPWGETKTEMMKWPKKATDEYKFVRLVRQCGYDLTGATQIHGDRVPFNNGSLVVPQQQSRRGRLKEYIQSIFTSSSDTDEKLGPSLFAFTILWPITSFLLVPLSFQDGDNVNFSTALGGLLWFAITFILFVL